MPLVVYPATSPSNSSPQRSDAWPLCSPAPRATHLEKTGAVGTTVLGLDICEIWHVSSRLRSTPTSRVVMVVLRNGGESGRVEGGDSECIAVAAAGYLGWTACVLSKAHRDVRLRDHARGAAGE